MFLVFFTLSSAQFSFTLSAKYKRSEKLTQSNALKLFELFFCTETWALFFMLITQDLPFFIIRLIIIIVYGVEKSYLLYFMLIKNAFLVILDSHMILNNILDERFRKKILAKEATHRKTDQELNTIF